MVGTSRLVYDLVYSIRVFSRKLFDNSIEAVALHHWHDSLHSAYYASIRIEALAMGANCPPLAGYRVHTVECGHRQVGSLK
jgi:hypothetical protein